MSEDATVRITELAQKLNVKAFVRKELRKLPEMLYEDEEVMNLTQGQYEGNQGLVVVTDRRVMFVDEGMIRSHREDFPYERISSVQCKKSLMSGTLTIFASGNKAVIKNVVPKDQAESIAEVIRSRIAGVANSGNELTAQSAAAASHDDPYEKLRKLGELRDAGVLSQEEFAAQKAAILPQL